MSEQTNVASKNETRGITVTGTGTSGGNKGGSASLSAYLRIKNTGKRLIGIPKSQPPGARGVIVGVSFSLKPGYNRVKTAEWEEAMQHLNVKRLVKAKTLQVFPEVSPKELDTDEAIELVENTFDLEQLRQYKRQDRRDEVIGAIEKQIELMTAQAEKDEDAAE